MYILLKTGSVLQSLAICLLKLEYKAVKYYHILIESRQGNIYSELINVYGSSAIIIMYANNSFGW